MFRALSAAAVLLCVASVPNHARAAEITLLSPGAVGSSLRELVDKLKQGEIADVAIVGSSAADELMTLGKFSKGSKVEIARVGVGVFVRRGDPKPDISSRDAFLRSVVNAKVISYSDPKLGGTAANYVGRLMDSLDVTGSIGPKTKLTPPAKPLADFVANGGADFGLTQITEILQDPRLELVGPLPADIQFYTDYAAGVMAVSQHQDAGKALIAYLATPAASTVMKSKGFTQL